eukprot:GILI01007722.1.p1 GENE.GILI01007722.1~~GILI01007722.1.p1  ORF type:complete len:185 (-),score=10.29 GILI01007722.1:36-590(-)
MTQIFNNKTNKRNKTKHTHKHTNTRKKNTHIKVQHLRRRRRRCSGNFDGNKDDNAEQQQTNDSTQHQLILHHSLGHSDERLPRSHQLVVKIPHIVAGPLDNVPMAPQVLHNINTELLGLQCRSLRILQCIFPLSQRIGRVSRPCPMFLRQPETHIAPSVITPHPSALTRRDSSSRLTSTLTSTE